MKQKYRVTLFPMFFYFFVLEDKMQKHIIMAGFVAALLSQTSICNAAEAGSATISLTDGIIVNKEKGEAKEFTKESLQEKIDENKAQTKGTAKEGKGIMSFLGFSLFGDGDQEAVQPQQNETQEAFMQRMYKQAESGDVDALMNLGYMNLYGLNGVEINYRKAFEYYNLAAQSGDDVAVNNLGSLYYSGVGVRKDIDRAAELFAKASDLGNTEATLNLAVIYLSSKDSLGNTEAAVDLLKKAAEKGNPTGKYLLGYAYLKGVGVPQNNRKAVENIRYAADKNYDEAQYMLGYLYEHGLGVTQNYTNALRYYTRAANQGNVSAILTLGNIYASGNRVEADYHKAHVMFNLATYFGVPDADKKRDMLEEKLKITELLQAQTEAENFSPRPSDLTKYIRSTFGESLARYVDSRAPVVSLKQ